MHFITGGSLTKLAYTATVQRKTSFVSDGPEVSLCVSHKYILAWFSQTVQVGPKI